MALEIAGATAGHDRAIAELRGGERAWARTPLARPPRTAPRARRGGLARGHEWVEIAARIKRLDPASPLVGEEWISGPYALLVVRVRAGRDAARALVRREPARGVRDRHGAGRRGPRSRCSRTGSSTACSSPATGPRSGRAPGSAATTSGRRPASPSWPRADPRRRAGPGRREHLLDRAAGRALPALRREPRRRTQAQPHHRARCDRCWGASSRRSSSATSSHRHRRGGRRRPPGAPPGIAAVHITGSEATHDAIVWGPAPGRRRPPAPSWQADHQRARRRVARHRRPRALVGRRPALPGRARRHPAAAQRRPSTASRRRSSSSAADWPQKDASSSSLQRRSPTPLRDRPGTPAAAARVAAARAATRPRRASASRDARRPASTCRPNETAFATEWFAPVLGVAELPGRRRASSCEPPSTPPTSGCTARSARTSSSTPAHRGARRHVRRAIAALRYGTIAINAWTGVGYLTPRATWGAFPGHTLDDIQSGIGVVHNALLLAGHRAHGRDRPGPVPSGSSPQAAVVRHQPDRRDHRPAPHRLRRAAAMERACRRSSPPRSGADRAGRADSPGSDDAPRTGGCDVVGVTPDAGTSREALERAGLVLVALYLGAVTSRACASACAIDVRRASRGLPRRIESRLR